MKKFLTLLLAAGMIVSAANGASAVEMKVSGSWLTSFTFADGLFGKSPLAEDADDGSFRANQQINLQMDLVMSESLSGTLLLRAAEGQDGAANYQWGTSGTGGQGNAVTARRAYLDWMIPTTDVLVRMGRQGVALPSYTFGSPVFDNTIDGVMVSAPINDTWPSMRAGCGLPLSLTSGVRIIMPTAASISPIWAWMWQETASRLLRGAWWDCPATIINLETMRICGALARLRIPAPPSTGSAWAAN